MLHIVASYHCMKFLGKLINQICEHGKKKLVSGPILAQIRADNLFFFFFFFSKICQSLDITASYNHVQYKKKLMNQSWENLVTDGRADGQ